jgi:hypothetical protein
VDGCERSPEEALLVIRWHDERDHGSNYTCPFG